MGFGDDIVTRMSLQNPAALIADKLRLDQKIPQKLLQETQSALRLFKLKHPSGSLGRSDNDLRRACALLEYVVREHGGIKIPMKQLSRAACMKEHEFTKFHQSVGNFRRSGSRVTKDISVPLPEASTIPSLTIKLGSYIKDPNGVALRALNLFQTLTRHAQELPATERGHQLRDIQDHRKAYEACCFFIAATSESVVKSKSTQDFNEDDNKRLQIQSIIDASNDFTVATFKSILQHVQSISQRIDLTQYGNSKMQIVQKDNARSSSSRESKVGRKRAPPVHTQSDRLAAKLLKSHNGLLSQKLALNATTDLLQQATRQLEESMEIARFAESGSQLQQQRFDDWKLSTIADALKLFNRNGLNQEGSEAGQTKTLIQMACAAEEILHSYMV